MQQKLEHREQRIAFEELLEGMRQEAERVQRLEQAIREAVPDWSLAEVATALQAMRGIDLVAAVTVLAEIGDLSRFQNPRELMGYLGLVPSESSTGDRVKRGGITKDQLACCRVHSIDLPQIAHLSATAVLGNCYRIP